MEHPPQNKFKLFASYTVVIVCGGGGDVWCGVVMWCVWCGQKTPQSLATALWARQTGSKIVQISVKKIITNQR